jgi:hypothetical protein
MAMASPLRTCLYRRLGGAVILAALAASAGAQIAVTGAPVKRDKPSAGPRAIGLVQIASNGKATLIPIAIMVDGKFYDAASYKASPTPMALEPGVVYEAIHTGVSQGLFTITGLRIGQNRTWFADGSWLAAGAVAPSVGHKAESAPRLEKFDEGPPRLRKSGDAAAEKPAPAPASAPADSKLPDTKPAETKSGDAKPAATENKPDAPASVPPAAAEAPEPEQPEAPPEDPNRPVLRRGGSKYQPPAPAAQPQAAAASSAKPAATGAPASAQGHDTKSAPSGLRTYPAISDAKGPDPRPYDYKTDAEQEAEFRKKMLALAKDEVRARARQLGDLPAAAPVAAKPPSTSRSRKATAPADDMAFDDVQLRVFDLSSSNEPVLVLAATARLHKGAGDAPGKQYFVTLVAREDIYADLHKAFSNVTDMQHLDVIPKVELVDAVDADGDSRGELMFRRVYDHGSAYVIYRQIGDQLWPLFEGTAP